MFSESLILYEGVEPWDLGARFEFGGFYPSLVSSSLIFIRSRAPGSWAAGFLMGQCMYGLWQAYGPHGIMSLWRMACMAYNLKQSTSFLQFPLRNGQKRELVFVFVGVVSLGCFHSCILVTLDSSFSSGTVLPAAEINALLSTWHRE